MCIVLCISDKKFRVGRCSTYSQIANKYKLMVIEDSADTLGGKINNRPTGFFSDISITSFYGSHVISCAGNGGMFLTNNKNFFLFTVHNVIIDLI